MLFSTLCCSSTLILWVSCSCLFWDGFCCLHPLLPPAFITAPAPPPGHDWTLWHVLHLIEFLLLIFSSGMQLGSFVSHCLIFHLQTSPTYLILISEWSIHCLYYIHREYKESKIWPWWENPLKKLDNLLLICSVKKIGKGDVIDKWNSGGFLLTGWSGEGPFQRISCVSGGQTVRCGIHIKIWEKSFLDKQGYMPWT